MGAALLVVDMLKEFVYGRLGFENARKIVPNIVKLVKEARKRKIPIFFICDSHKQEDYELKIWGPHALEGSEEAQLIPQLKPEEGEGIIKKNTYDGFFKTSLEKELKKKRVSEVILAGIMSDICVQHTAAGAFFREFKVVIVKDAVAALTKERNDAALNYMKKNYGAKIVSLNDLFK